MTPAEIVTEFRKKYEGCYMHVQMPDSAEDNLFYLAAVVQQRGETQGILKLESEEFGKIQLNMGTAHTLKFKFPQVGVFQSGANAYFFKRDPRRQWQRGLCPQNASITAVSALFESRTRIADTMNFTLVDDAFKGVCFTYVQAIKMLASGKYRSVALADGFSVMLSPTMGYAYLLLYRTLPVAGIAAGAGPVQVLEPAFEPQVKQITS